MVLELVLGRRGGYEQRDRQDFHVATVGVQAGRDAIEGLFALLASLRGWALD
jgi:hypothetical protein